MEPLAGQFLQFLTPPTQCQPRSTFHETDKYIRCQR